MFILIAETVTVLGEKATRQISKKVAYLTELDMFYDSFSVEKMIAFYESQFPDFSRNKANQLMKEMNLSGKEENQTAVKGESWQVEAGPYFSP